MNTINFSFRLCFDRKAADVKKICVTHLQVLSSRRLGGGGLEEKQRENRLTRVKLSNDRSTRGGNDIVLSSLLVELIQSCGHKTK